PLPHEALKEYSPEAEQLLKRYCTKRCWPLPAIEVMPTDLPLIFSYGWRPRYGRLVLSQGLLQCLSSDELSALMMYEVAHWSSWDWVLFSMHGLLVQTFHGAYWFFAQWGMSRSTPLKISAGILATLCYWVYWVLVKVACGLSRTRIYYRDRIAVEMTGNPNGLMRGLAKVATAMHQAIQRQGYTPPLLESLELMLPVAPAEAVSTEQFAWGALHPLRHWFAINHGHSPLGDRLYTLGAYGRHWRLKPSLNLARLRLRHGSRPLTRRDWQTLILWGGLWSGALLGLGVALILWLVGALSTAMDFPFLAWLYRDRSILMSMPLIGAGTVQLIRINPLFPDIPMAVSNDASCLQHWQTDIKLTPLSSLPAQVSGMLTGRPGLANWLGQEWRLQTDYGNIKLQYIAHWGPLSNVKSLALSLNQPLRITGWLRRGHTIWIDIERWQSHTSDVQDVRHPIWAMIVSLVPLAYGVWLILSGG
ncbi:MAG: M48 family metalloprotease, partial [Cyanobacteria bacterium J06642_11]